MGEPFFDCSPIYYLSFLQLDLVDAQQGDVGAAGLCVEIGVDEDLLQIKNRMAIARCIGTRICSLFRS